MKLNSKNVRSEPAPKNSDGKPKADAIVFDDDGPGLGLRIRQAGSRTLIFQYKIGLEHRRLVLGRVGAVDFGEARNTAERLYARVRLGEDPAGDKATSKAKAARTFEAVAEAYLAHKRDTVRVRTFVEIERHLRKHAKALHRLLHIEKIDRADIATCVATVRKNSDNVAGNRVRSTLSAMYGWLLGEGLVSANPVIGTNIVEEKSRERVLSPLELRAIWNALADDHYAAILRLLALTGARASEVSGLRWTEVQDAQIVLPRDRTKNGRAHIIPLSAVAAGIIAAQPRRTEPDGTPRDLIFGSAPASPFSGWTAAKEALDAAITKAAGGKALPHWTPHDLRRSFATHAGELGIQPHIVECVLNHTSGFRAGVSGVYNRNTYEREKRQALDLWADQLLAWVEDRPSNITPLRAGGHAA